MRNSGFMFNTIAFLLPSIHLTNEREIFNYFLLHAHTCTYVHMYVSQNTGSKKIKVLPAARPMHLQIVVNVFTPFTDVVVFIRSYKSIKFVFAFVFLVYTIGLTCLFIVTQAVVEQLKSGRVLSIKEFFVGIWVEKKC